MSMHLPARCPTPSKDNFSTSMHALTVTAASPPARNSLSRPVPSRRLHSQLRSHSASPIKSTQRPSVPSQERSFASGFSRPRMSRSGCYMLLRAHAPKTKRSFNPISASVTYPNRPIPSRIKPRVHRTHNLQHMFRPAHVFFSGILFVFDLGSRCFWLRACRCFDSCKVAHRCFS